MPGVTISAGYGTGGSAIAPLVAERLGLPLLDRAISSDVAAQLHVTVEEAEGGAFKRSLVGRFLAVLAPLAGGALGAGTDAAPPHAVPPPDDADLFREQADAIMRAALASGAVILGRGGAAAFRDEPGVLRVRLFGPAQARIAHATRAQGSRRCRPPSSACPRSTDARAVYVRRLYCCDIDDPALFNLQLDSTALPAEACADIIVRAYRALPGLSAQSGWMPHEPVQVPPGGSTISPVPELNASAGQVIGSTATPGCPLASRSGVNTCRNRNAWSNQTTRAAGARVQLDHPPAVLVGCTVNPSSIRSAPSRRPRRRSYGVPATGWRADRHHRVVDDDPVAHRRLELHLGDAVPAGGQVRDGSRRRTARGPCRCWRRRS